MREDFTQRVKDELAKRVGYQCSRPGCRRNTSGPRLGDFGTVSVGVAAHITGASPGGPRYDPDKSPAERVSARNGIWLCQWCAKLVDSDVLRYSVEKLYEWKSDAEAAAHLALENRLKPSNDAGVLAEAMRLMPDLIAAIRSDVLGDSTELLRDAAILPNESILYNDPSPAFLYLANQHPDLRAKFRRLEDWGLVRDMTRGSVPKYRFTDTFVDWLRGE